MSFKDLSTIQISLNKDGPGEKAKDAPAVDQPVKEPEQAPAERAPERQS